MPGYISHAIMGEQVHKEASDEHLFIIPISVEELKGYSIGADYSYLSKKLNDDPHNSHTQEFFISIVQYVKEHHLVNNKHIMALLYGHIAHYFLDIKLHPLIYHIENNTKQIGLIPKHNLIEGYISSYLSEQVLNKSITEINHTYFNKINLSDSKVSSLLNHIYGKIYGDYNIIKTYKKTLFLLTKLEQIVKNKIFTKETLIQISKFNKYIEQNNLTLEQLTNINHNIYTNNITKEEYHESILELYNKSIELSLEAIYEVNNYLYLNSPLSILYKIFQDLSYDTGLKCTKIKKRFLPKSKFD